MLPGRSLVCRGTQGQVVGGQAPPLCSKAAALTSDGHKAVQPSHNFLSQKEIGPGVKGSLPHPPGGLGPQLCLVPWGLPRVGGGEALAAFLAAQKGWSSARPSWAQRPCQALVRSPVRWGSGGWCCHSTTQHLDLA